MHKAIYKVPNGKLLKVFLEQEGGRISKIMITGDFFVHPEERIEEMERRLIGCALVEAELKERLELFLAGSPTVLFGVDVPALVSTILSACAVA